MLSIQDPSIISIIKNGDLQVEVKRDSYNANSLSNCFIEISLHTGYADLRYGAFVLREKVQTFLSQLSSQGLEAYKLKHADIYFSIWLNQYPYMISNPLLSNGRDRFKDVDTVNNRELIEYFMVSHYNVYYWKFNLIVLV